jgi:hypothetical protein
VTKLVEATTVRARFTKIPSPTGPPPSGLTRSDPVPIGTALAISTADAPTGWKLQVNSATPDATDQILAVSEFNAPPALGDQFFMVSITATWTGAGSADSSEIWGLLNAVGASNVAYPPGGEDFCGQLPDPDFVEVASGPVFTGGFVTGNICWSVSSDDAGSLEMYADRGTPAWFALH